MNMKVIDQVVVDIHTAQVDSALSQGEVKLFSMFAGLIEACMVQINGIMAHPALSIPVIETTTPTKELPPSDQSTPTDADIASGYK